MNRKNVLKKIGIFSLGVVFLAVATGAAAPEKSKPVAPVAAVVPVVSESLSVKEGKVDFFAIGKPSMLKIHGTAQSLEGSFTPTEKEVSGHFVIKMDGFTTGMGLRDSHTKDKVFDVEKFPTSELTLKPMPFKSGEKTKFSGILKFHGVEKTVEGETTVTVSPTGKHIDANLVILLTDYNVKPPEFMGMKINNDVRIEVSADSVK